MNEHRPKVARADPGTVVLWYVTDPTTVAADATDEEVAKLARVRVEVVSRVRSKRSVYIAKTRADRERLIQHIKEQIARGEKVGGPKGRLARLLGLLPSDTPGASPEKGDGT